MTYKVILVNSAQCDKIIPLSLQITVNVTKPSHYKIYRFDPNVKSRWKKKGP